MDTSAPNNETPTPEVVTPVTQQAVETKKSPATPATPSTLILQWLTYSFWGLTILALSVLTFIVIYNLINHSESGSASLYTLAAIIVLLPISLVCDFLYQKREPHKKTGASAAILAIHAVIFALFGIGVLITGLFAIVQLIVDANSAAETDSAIARLVSSLIVTVLYGLVFVRTLNPFKKIRFFPKIHAIVMGVVILTFAVLAFIGPFALQLATKQDRLIDSNISYIANAIERQAERSNALPDSLQDIGSTSEGGQQLIDEELVTYKPEQPDPRTGNLRYQLCTTYAAKDSNRYNSYNESRNDYQTYLDTTGHKKGDVCYKLEVIMPKSSLNNIDLLINDRAQ